MEKFFRVTYKEVITTTKIVRATTMEEAMDIVINREPSLTSQGKRSPNDTASIGTKATGDRDLVDVEEVENPEWLRSFS